MLVPAMIRIQLCAQHAHFNLMPEKSLDFSLFFLFHLMKKKCCIVVVFFSRSPDLLVIGGVAENDQIATKPISGIMCERERIRLCVIPN